MDEMLRNVNDQSIESDVGGFVFEWVNGFIYNSYCLSRQLHAEESCGWENEKRKLFDIEPLRLYGMVKGRMKQWHSLIDAFTMGYL